MSDLGQIITISILAIALGMDAFSLGLALGMQKFSLPRMIYVSGLVGIFHLCLPLFGMWIGSYLSFTMKGLATVIGGGMLLFLGCKMIWQEQEEIFRKYTLAQILLLTISVSVDSLSAGLSLGIFATDPWLTIGLFGSAGTILTAMGLSIGRYAGNWLGKYGETVGGIILIILGVKFIW